jgi:hypothetical protein
VEYYETSVKPPRRSKKEFHMTADRRTQLLLDEWQYPEEDLQRARREATYVQYCRAKTSFSGSRAAAKEAAFLRKANSRPKPSINPAAVTAATAGALPLNRVSHQDLSVESVVSAAMQQQQRHLQQQQQPPPPPPQRKSPPGKAGGNNTMSRNLAGSFNNSPATASVTMDLASSLESQVYI